MVNEKTDSLLSIRDQIRKQCLTDKLALGRVLGYDFQEDPHREMFDNYIRFDNSKPLLWQQSSIYNRLTLWPRGHFKTSSIVVEIVQLILNFPDVRIMLMQSTVKNTKELLQEVRGHFNGSNPNSKMSKYFPEFCAERLGNSMGFRVPARKRTNLKEPTVYVASPKATKAGFHFDVGFFDDLVTEVNYKNPELMKKLVKDFSHYAPLIDPGGYKYVTGTRYTFGDLYEWIIRHNDGRWHVSQRKCFKYDYEKKQYLLDATGKKQVIFPQAQTKDGRTVGFTVALLEAIERDDPETFAAQYLNEPIIAGEQVFPDVLMMSRVKSAADPSIPALGPAYMVADDATGDSDDSDHRVIMVARLDGFNRIWITDVRGGTFTPAVFAAHYLDMVLKHRPVKIIQQKTSAAVFFSEYVRTLARDKGLVLPIELVKVVNAKDAKRTRILTLEGPLKQGRIWFYSGLPQWPRILQDFTQISRTKLGEHDDYPDALSILFQNIAATTIFQPPRQRSIYDVIMTTEADQIIKAEESPLEQTTLGSFFA